MKNQNHKISRQIVDTAIQENVSIIKLERLENIRKTARTSHAKTQRICIVGLFYQLQQFISYKANLVGIKIVEVNPAYTSQTILPVRRRTKRKTEGTNVHADSTLISEIGLGDQYHVDGRW
ncbi:transposase [Paenibacillus larvae]|nr:transposase [Paenibacillus larvae]MDT2237107.1 transposase [Paenibacillus larvae]